MLASGMGRRVLVSTVVVVACGSLLHFAWDWSGRNWMVGLIAATNESVWEHLKLAFWPALMLAPVQRLLYGSCPGWWPATAVRCVLPPLLIALLYYGYTALVGGHLLIADLAVFVVAVFAGEAAGHALLPRAVGVKVTVACVAVVVMATVAFSTLTYRAPQAFLFEDPSSDHAGENDYHGQEGIRRGSP